MYTDTSLTATIPQITTAASNYSSKYPAATVWDIQSIRDVASGHNLKLVINLATAFATTTPGDIANSLIEINVEMDDNSSFSSPTFVAKVCQMTGSILAAPDPLASGRPVTMIVPFPPPIGNVNYLTLAGSAWGLQGARYERYIRVFFTAVNSSSVAFSASGTGSISLVIDAQDGRQFYADAVSTLPNPV
ncbi:MAG: hypothetical protein ACK5S6_02570 [bacterium]